MAVPTLLGNLYIDAVTRRNYSAPITVTSNTIETGEQLAEHVVDQIETLTLDIVLSDDRYSYFGVQTAAIQAANRITTRDDKKRELYALKNAKSPLNIIMFDESYFDFAIVDIIADEIPENISTFQTTVVLQKIKTVLSLVQKVPLETIRKKADANKTRAAIQQTSTEDGGQVATTETPEDDSTLTRNLARAIVGGIWGD